MWLLAIHVTANDIRFSRIGIEEGLIGHSVHSIIQDQNNFLWLATDNGLNRYDGYTFKLFNSETTNGEAPNYVNTLYEDSQGRIWIGSKGEGILYYSPDIDVFTAIDLKDASRDIIAKDIYAFEEDKYGRIWVGTYEAGIYLIDTNGTISNFTHDTDDTTSISSNYIRRIYCTPENSIWVGTRNGLNKAAFSPSTPHSISFERYQLQNNASLISFAEIMAISAYNDSLLLVGTWGDGLFLFDTKANSVLDNSRFKNDKLYPSVITSIKYLKNGNILVGSFEKGIYLYSNKLTPINHWKNNPVDEYSIHNDNVWSILEDESGILWVGSALGSLCKTDLQYQRFKHYQYSSNNTGLTDNKVHSFAEDKKGNIYIGTAKGGVNILDPKTETFSTFNEAFSINHPIFQSTIYALHYENDELWIGSVGSGVMRFNTVTGEYQTYEHDPQNRNSIASNEVNDFYLDEDGLMWIGTWGGGLSCLDLSTDTFANYDLKKGNIHQNIVFSIQEDKHKQLWLSTYGLGVAVFNKKTRTFDFFFSTEPTLGFRLSSNKTTELYIDSRDDIWIGTNGNGLDFIDTETYTLTNFSKHNGLKNDIVQSIVEDANGNIWVGGNRGISKVNIEDSTISNFSVKDGLQNNLFVVGANLLSASGKMYFGGINGINTFYPDSINKSTYEPDIAITELKINNTIVSPGDTILGYAILSQSITSTDTIVFSYKHNIIGLEFSSLHYSGSEYNRYTYMLEGFDKEWINVGAQQRYAQYTNLEPGTYTFKVKGTNRDGIWSSHTKALTIVVTPPVWKTWPAYIVYGLISLFLFFIVWQVSMMSTNHKHALRLKEIENNKIKEIHDAKLVFFTDISHEIRTPLTLIIEPLNRIIKDETLTSVIKAKLSPIKNNADRLLNLVNQLIDFRKIDTGNLNLSINQYDIVSLIKESIQAFNDYAFQKRIKLSYSSPVPGITIWIDGEKIRKVLYNLLSNAIKFTKENGKVDFSIQVSSHSCEKFPQGYIEIAVSDTGAGIDTVNQTKVFERFYQVNNNTGLNNKGSGIGLALTQKIIEQHKGTISLKSTPGEGSVFTVKLHLGNALVSDLAKIPATSLEESAPIGLQQEEELVTEATPDTSQKKHTIAIVEDNDEIRQFIRSIFNDQYNIIEAPNGASALELINKELPDLVISDIMMPEMNGIDLCTAIKQSKITNYIPVILLTAKTGVESTRKGLEIGADDYITKPFDSELLELKVNNLISLRENQRAKFQKYALVDTSTIKSESPEEKFLIQVSEVINSHMKDEDFTVDNLAREVGLSRSQLFRKFKVITSQTPNDFIKDLRLQKGEILLKQKELSIKEISFEIGYSNPRYFSKLFSQKYGVSPSKYMEQTEV